MCQRTSAWKIFRFFGDFCGCFMWFVQGFWCQVFRWHLGAHPPKNYCNISHLGKRQIIFKVPWEKDMLVPWRVNEFCFFILMVALSLHSHSLKEKVTFNTPSFTFHIKKGKPQKAAARSNNSRAKWTGILSSVYHCWWLVVSSPNWFLLWLCIPTDP